MMKGRGTRDTKTWRPDQPELASLPGMTNKESWYYKQQEGFKRVKGFRPKSADASKRSWRVPKHGLGEDYVNPALIDDDDLEAFNFHKEALAEITQQALSKQRGDVLDDNDGVITSGYSSPRRTMRRPRTAGVSGGEKERRERAYVTATSPIRTTKGRSENADEMNATYRETQTSTQVPQAPLPLTNKLTDTHVRNIATGKMLPNVPYLEAAVPPKLVKQDLLERSMRREHQNHQLDRVYSQKRIEHCHPEDDAEEIVRTEEVVDPDFVDETKIVCRYQAYFTQPRVWDDDPLIGTPVVETEIVHHLTINFYVCDGEVRMFEKLQKNVGIEGGQFYAKGPLKKDDEENARIGIIDLIPGQVIRALGLEITITDADPATRKFCAEVMNIELPPAIPHPKFAREDIGMHIALGMGGRDFPPRADNKFPPTYEFFQRKEQLTKTRRFLFNDNQPLRFDCIEICDGENDGVLSWAEYRQWEQQNIRSGNKDALVSKIVVPNTLRRNCLVYYIPDYCVEVQAAFWPGQPQKFTEQGLILKRSKLQKNWREATKGKKEPIYFEPNDFEVGKIVDLYGRYYFLVSADQYTQRKYEEIGVVQKRIDVEMQVIPPIVQPIPQLGDGFLAIGDPEQTLATVYGHKHLKDAHADKGPGSFKERNRGKTIKCLMKMVTDRREDVQRLFALTYFIEDDHLTIYEEVERNSGIWGGTFLNKGRYTNYLPGDGERPRYFKPQDIYLGNIISPNNVLFRIFEMDGATLKFMEANPEEFPFSDTFEIVLRLVDECVDNAVNCRKNCKQMDKRKCGAFNRNDFIDMIDSFISSSTRGCDVVKEDEELSEASAVAESSEPHHHHHHHHHYKKRVLNEHELMTVLRRFKNHKSNNVFHYDELCDLFSHIYYTRDLKQKPARNQKLVNSLKELEIALRPMKTQWRRAFRLDERCLAGVIAVGHFTNIMNNNRIQLSEECLQELVHCFQVNRSCAAKYRSKIGGYRPESSVASMGSQMSVSTIGTMGSLVSKKSTVSKGLSLGKKADQNIHQEPSELEAVSSVALIIEKRRQLHQSVLRKGPAPTIDTDSVRAKAAVAAAKEARYDLESSVLNVHKLFDTIYKMEWSF